MHVFIAEPRMNLFTIFDDAAASQPGSLFTIMAPHAPIDQVRLPNQTERNGNIRHLQASNLLFTVQRYRLQGFRIEAS